MSLETNIFANVPEIYPGKDITEILIESRKNNKELFETDNCTDDLSIENEKLKATIDSLEKTVKELKTHISLFNQALDFAICDESFKKDTEIISKLATVRYNFEHSLPWESDVLSSISARSEVKLLQNELNMLNDTTLEMNRRKAEEILQLKQDLEEKKGFIENLKQKQELLEEGNMRLRKKNECFQKFQEKINQIQEIEQENLDMRKLLSHHMKNRKLLLERIKQLESNS
eukprot:TRINITY_DN43_c0_g1_i1.p1 TRINITY_DN43_c0_g1~~TRINITY_DN43_c0_g1_i1.p1  ORF type:complete len:231 (-),score=81.06 TRINITY_DN43_c0_g1_i1:87-779(-)